ncbi:hypothetical protein [Sinorhizobium fredii]|nr:hypothetical protein [Sinorhizobium fredii]ASY68866.1 hypothetical protein SF83666_c14450 [Sinorhizobium fredii CCBAU 83666]
MQIRLPTDVAEFLEQAAKANLTSRNAEIVRSCRERMQAERIRLQAEGIPPSAEGFHTII